MSGQNIVLDLLKNRTPNAILGPFDSKVSAIVRVEGTPYFVTTNVDYIPAIPVRENHTVYLREDYRFGDDDPTLWPQGYSSRVCHLAAIHKKVTNARSLSSMWWDPLPDDFVSAETGLEITRGLGKLKPSSFARLVRPIDGILEECENYKKSLKPPAQLNIMFPPLIHHVLLVRDRLHNLPSTRQKMILGVRELQRTVLELDGLLRYMKTIVPRMESGAVEAASFVEKCVGAFTLDPTVAQQFRAAGLPYWFLRPTFSFQDTIILDVVDVVDPATEIEVNPAPDFPAIPTGPATNEKLKAMRETFRSRAWYYDPFAEPMRGGQLVATPPGPSAPPPASSSPAPVTPPVPVAGSSKGGSSKGSGGRKGGRGGYRGGRAEGGSRYNPLDGARSSSAQNRDKFEIYQSPDMPPAVPAWAAGLRSVDRTRGPAENPRYLYLFPEPALLVTAKDETKRQLALQHYTMLREALQYRLGNESNAPLGSQAWRDVLFGTVHVSSTEGSKAHQRSALIDDVLGPAIRAVGLHQYDDFPAQPGSFPPISHERAREIVWDVAECGFRFEFLTLDRRASGLARPDDCRKCFAGGELMGMPLAASKQGLAAASSADRHPYIMRIAHLMKDWHPRPAALIAEAHRRTEWTDEEQEALEMAVAAHYTQSFFTLFGRAPTIPMRLDHDI
ncbi:hypothetical protein B0H15DRAFT_963730 [Mycena belliarum]|uniref:Uncharacterized protein n=1 Tax=Mycena belliarum TaxID=1033014 RepID=A0AAD6TQH8_9AGAR|nr:hypothetical protein B0H15DRAFT_963730 [Mycena belliae]